MYKYFYSCIIVMCITCNAIAQEAGDVNQEPKKTLENNNQESKKTISEGSPFSQVKFNPDLALIVDTSAVYRSLCDDVFSKTSIRGFDKHAGGDGHHNLLSANENIGFNLNYAEIALMATVDPYFELVGIMHASPASFEIEEGYFSTTCIPGGFGFKAGKFLSGFGKLNGQHSHQWDFADPPLPYLAILGEEGLNEPGAQLTWVAPADFFLTIGAEALQGKNEASFGTESFHDPLYLQRVSGSKGPNAYNAFLKSSFDINRLTVVMGVSGIMGEARYYHNFSNVDLDNINIDIYGSLGEGLRAKTWIANGELVMKYFIDSFRYISFQGECLYRIQQGRFFYTSLFPFEAATLKMPYYAEQWGAYAQVIIKPLLRWRFGARGDMISTRTLRIGGNLKVDEATALYRASGMIDFHPSEFSLFRLQYSYDRSRFNRFNHVKPDHEVILQANLAIGAHGAHPF